MLLQDTEDSCWEKRDTRLQGLQRKLEDGQLVVLMLEAGLLSHLLVVDEKD